MKHRNGGKLFGKRTPDAGVRRHKTAPLLFLGAIAIAWALSGAAALRSDSSPTEYDVKAAYLYQFGKFVEWPEGSLTPSGNTFAICILGVDPFGNALDDTISGRSVQGKQVLVKRLPSPGDVSDCNVLFVSSSEENHAPDILKVVEGKSILTVGDSKSFLQQGGMINFQMEQNKVRFEINLAALERANLKMSSELLKVATRIKQ